MDTLFHNNNSIAVSPIIAQEGIGSNSPTQDASVAEFPIANQEGNTEEPEKGETGTLFSKYRYDEFIGFKGYDRLDRITQLILTAANCRTWRNADKFVAPGNDCYAGAYAVADIIKPGVRKVEMDFKSLRELDLIDIFPDYRLVKQRATGKVEMTACMVKDFSKLYALAHEYSLWEQSPEYIPPDWKYKELILANEALTAKLRRFDNYRRILECHKPGRKPGQAEPPLSHADMQAIAAEDAGMGTPSTDPKRYNNTYNETFSPNRVTRIPQGELNQDTSRSGGAARLGGKGGMSAMAIGNEYGASTGSTNADTQRMLPPSNTNISSPLEEPRGAEHAEGVAPSKPKRKKHAKGDVPPPLPGYLRDVILKPISTYFCDQAPASSETSLAWLFAEFGQRGMDEYNEYFIDLINEARDITNVKMRQGQIRGRNKDGSVAQMPYFFSILETNVDVWCKEYDTFVQDLGVSRDESTQAQEELHHEEAASLSDASEEHTQEEEQQLAPTSTLLEEGSTLPPASLDEQETPSREESGKEGGQPLAFPLLGADEDHEQAQDREIVGFIDTDNPDDGWRHATAVREADRLHNYLGQDRYQCAILPTRCHGRYGIIIVERQSGTEWVYVTAAEVGTCMQQRR